MIDLTLNAIQIPAIAGYTPPFGTKKSSGGLSTQEVNDNIIAGFARQRPVAVTVTDVTSEVQYNATLSIGTDGITLTLDDGAYIGCTVTVIASAAATISYNSGSTITTAAGQMYRFTWLGSTWLMENSVAVLEALHPVGSLYITEGNTCPLSSLIPDSIWVLVAQDMVLQGAGTRGAAGTTVAESLPNILGTVEKLPAQTVVEMTYGSGAFSETETSMDVKCNSSGSVQPTVQIQFDASDSSSVYQDGAPVQQDAYLVNIFKRTL